MSLDTRRIVLALAAAATIGSIGCTLVGDRVTGLSVSSVSPCIKECADTQSAAVQAEAEQHQVAIEACQALSNSEREACQSAETTRHTAAMVQISADRDECMNSCHKQGAGNAG